MSFLSSLPAKKINSLCNLHDRQGFGQLSNYEFGMIFVFFAFSGLGQRRLLGSRTVRRAVHSGEFAFSFANKDAKEEADNTTRQLSITF